MPLKTSRAAGLSAAAQDLQVRRQAARPGLRRTGGKIGGKWRIGAGFRKPVPTLLVEHRGRKSGNVFVTPLLYMLHGADVVTVASQGGRREHPQWYVTANPGERARLRPKLVEAYAEFDNYQSCTEREILVVVLQPR